MRPRNVFLFIMGSLKLLLSFWCWGLVALGCLSSCTESEPTAVEETTSGKAAKGIVRTADLEGKRAGFVAGSPCRDALVVLQPSVAEYPEFKDDTELLQAVRDGKIDAALVAEPVARQWAARYPSDLYCAFTYPDTENTYAAVARYAQSDTAKPQPEISSVAEAVGKKAGIWTGTVADNITRKYFPDSEYVQYTKMSDNVLALKNGKIDFFTLEEPQARLLQRQHPDLCLMSDDMLEGWDYAFAFSFEKREICEEFSQEIKKLMADGTVARLKEKWFSPTSEKNMPPLPKGSRGTLCIGTVPEVEPFTYIQNGEYVGLDLELSLIIAERLGYTVEFRMMDFASLAETLNSGKVDMVASCITVTEERKEQMLFAESHYRGGCVVVVRNLATEPQAALFSTAWWRGLWADLGTSFERTFVREERWKLVVEGLSITIIITLAAAVLGTALAFPLWLMRTSGSRMLRGISTTYISLMQGTPILVILMILYYIIFASVDINSIWVAIIGFGLNMSAYVGEMLRTGIDGVPKGQREASLALGFNRFQTFRKVVLPQALRQILPVYRGEFVSMLKMTSIVGYIAIEDLTKMSDIIRSRTYEAFFPLIATAVIYFLTAMALASFLNYIEYRLNPANRRKQG